MYDGLNSCFLESADWDFTDRGYSQMSATDALIEELVSRRFAQFS